MKQTFPNIKPFNKTPFNNNDIQNKSYQSNYLNFRLLFSPKSWFGLIDAIKRTVPGYSSLLSNVLILWITNICIPLILLRIVPSSFRMQLNSRSGSSYQGIKNGMSGFFAYIDQSPTNHWHEMDQTRFSTVDPIIDRSHDERFANVSGSIHQLSTNRHSLSHIVQSTVDDAFRHLNHFVHFPTVCALIFSPQGLHTMHQTSILFQETWARLNAFRIFRAEAQEDAIAAFQQAADSQRLIRARYYDLYLPSSPTSIHADGTPSQAEKGIDISSRNKQNDQSTNRKKILLVIPGAFVDHTAYARIASKISQEGKMIVAVLSMEPFRFATPILGASISHVSRVMNQILRKLKRMDKEAAQELENELTGSCGYEFCILGHSLGGYTALQLAPNLAKIVSKPRENPSQQRFKVVTFASGSNTKFMNDLPDWATYTATSNSSINLEYLCLFASNDRMCMFSTQQAWENFKSKLPPSPQSTYVTIQGATHNNFASYASRPQFDGIAEITRIRQQEIACQESISFLYQ